MPTRPPAHQPFRATARQSHDQTRGNSTERGYNHRWRRFRLTFLASNPLCHDCKVQERITAATEVHHRVKVRDRADLMFDPSNCMALCHDCHSTRTARGE